MSVPEIKNLGLVYIEMLCLQITSKVIGQMRKIYPRVYIYRDVLFTYLSDMYPNKMAPTRNPNMYIDCASAGRDPFEHTKSHWNTYLNKHTCNKNHVNMHLCGRHVMI